MSSWLSVAFGPVSYGYMMGFGLAEWPRPRMQNGGYVISLVRLTSGWFPTRPAPPFRTVGAQARRPPPCTGEHARRGAAQALPTRGRSLSVTVASQAARSTAVISSSAALPARAWAASCGGAAALRMA